MQGTPVVGAGEKERGEFGEALEPISYVWQTPARRPRRQPEAQPDMVGRGGDLPPGDRARLERIVARAPEVMVKITGRTKGLDHLLSHLTYITRNGELAAETEQGNLLAGREGLRDLQARWAQDVTLDQRRRQDGTLSINMILSMPPGTDALKVRDAVRAFAIESFEGRHDYAFVLHQDDDHPHVHLTVRSLGHEGRRLNPRKGDLVTWRERFAEELRLRGVEAEATPRRTRGRLRKAERGAVRAMQERGVAPRVERLAREEIVREARGEGRAERPWEARALQRQAAIRARYQKAVDDLAQSREPADQALADRIRTFLATWPVPRLKRHDLRDALSERAEEARASRAQELDRGRPTPDRERDRER
ncbi:MAG TPA: relaxase/mobilization nuclease domain-containing protein [Microvirga sp.]|jgi:hypothetical protein|nr:relaxase/mobilization nuclease domain-containing protein [Microvirga sp.]